MARQLVGAGSVLVMVLGYVLIVQALAAVIVLLLQFIVIQVRTLRTLLVQEPPRTPVPSPAREVHESRGKPTQQVVIGGGLRRWE